MWNWLRNQINGVDFAVILAFGIILAVLLYVLSFAPPNLGSDGIWLALTAFGTIAAVVTALLISIRQQTWRERHEMSDIVTVDARTYYQDKPSLDDPPRQIVLRLDLINRGFLASSVQAIVRSITVNSRVRENFLPVPLFWTHGTIYHPSSVVRDIQRNQTAHLDLCSGSTLYDDLRISTPITGNADFDQLETGVNSLEIEFNQRSGQTFFIVVDVTWEQGNEPMVTRVGDRTLEPTVTNS
jgi:hypothetical protein